MKIGKYILELVPVFASEFKLLIPYNNSIQYTTGNIIYGTTKRANFLARKYPKIYYIFSEEYLDRKGFFLNSKELGFKKCKYIKLNTGIRYKILGKYWKILIIKQLN